MMGCFKALLALHVDHEMQRTGKEIQHRNQITIKKCEGYNNYAMLKVKVPTCV